MEGLDRKPHSPRQDAINRLKEYVEIEKGGEGVLREAQIPVLHSLYEYLLSGKTRGKVVLPTGVGKTVLFTLFSRALRLPTLIVVPTRKLVHQTGDKVQQFAPEVEYGKVFTAAKEYGRPVTITTYDSLIAGLSNGRIDPRNFELVILDEAHESLTDLRQDAIGRFAETSVILEFTATDAYSETKKLTSDEICRMTLLDAIHTHGLLSALSCVIAQTDVDLTDVGLDNKGEYDEVEFRRRLDEKGVNKACVSLYANIFNGQQALVFTRSIGHSKEVKTLFDEEFGKGLAERVDSDNTEEHANIIAKYERGEIKVLLGVDLLTRGFDVPNATVCFNLVPTFSLVRATQRGGRVLRIDPNNPNKLAVVIDFTYADRRKNKKQICFAQVVGKAFVTPPHMKDKVTSPVPGQGAHSGSRGRSDPITIEGTNLSLVVDMEEVMRISSLATEDEKFLSPHILLQEIKKSIPSPTNARYNAFVAANRSMTRRWPTNLGKYLKRNGIPVTVNEWFGVRLLEPEDLRDAILAINGKPDHEWYVNFIGNSDNAGTVALWPAKLGGYLQSRGLGTPNEWFGVRLLTPDVLRTRIADQTDTPSSAWYRKFIKENEGKPVIAGWPTKLDGYLSKYGFPSPDKWFNARPRYDHLEPDDLLREIHRQISRPTSKWYYSFVEDEKNREIIKNWPGDLRAYLRKRKLPPPKDWLK